MLLCSVKKLNMPIDCVGQELSSKLMYLIFLLGYTIALVLGVAFCNLALTVCAGVATVAVALLLIVPLLKFYCRNQLKFRAPNVRKRDE